MKDRLDRSLRVGDICAYGFVIARVEGFTSKKVEIIYKWFNDSNTVLTTTVIPKSLTVLSRQGLNINFDEIEYE